MNLLCSFDVLPSNVCEIDIIIGLDVLTKNQAVVDMAVSWPLFIIIVIIDFFYC